MNLEVRGNDIGRLTHRLHQWQQINLHNFVTKEQCKVNDQEENRFEMLRHGPCVPADYIRGFYGISWPLLEDILHDFNGWAESLKKRHECGEECISRYELETFMQKRQVIPQKWMAVRLGMTQESLAELTDKLDKIGMKKERYLIYSEMISEALSEDIVSNLRGLRFRTFSDHNSFCERLHQTLKDDLGIDVQPVYCETSLLLKDYARWFANNFDCITLAPISGKHQMWLDFRKPLNLGPDRCSKLFYAQNREGLRPYCAGTQEPEDLEYYIQLVKEKNNA